MADLLLCPCAAGRPERPKCKKSPEKGDLRRRLILSKRETTADPGGEGLSPSAASGAGGRGT